MVDNLKRLKNRRRACKERLVLFEKYLEEITTNKEPQKIDELEIRLERLNKLLNEFDDLQSEIESLSDDLTEIEERESFENLYFLCSGNAKKLLETYRATNGDNASRQVDSNSVAFVSHTSNIRLPTISMPKFNGNYEQWLDFRDTFKSLIHNNSDLSVIQKYHYLKSSLEGDSARVIQSLTLSENNYMLAYQLLCERYDKNNLLVHHHLKSLFNLPSNHNQYDTAVSIRQLHDEVSKHLRSLESLNQSTDNWDAFIVFLILDKVDAQTTKEWEMQMPIENPTREHIFEFLRNRAALLEKIRHKTQHKTNSNKIFNTKSSNHTTKVFHIENTTNAEIICFYCKGLHYIYACAEFRGLSINERINYCRKNRLCLNCLKMRHLTKFCRSHNCRECGGRHNSLLHIKHKTNINVENSHDDSNEDSNQEIIGEQPTVCAHSQTSQDVLLSTAVVDLFDFHGKRHSCRVLLDSGSQSNFVTSDLCKRLQIPLFLIKVAVMGIGQNISNLNQKCDITIYSRVGKFSTNLSFLVVDKITDSLPTRTFHKSLVTVPQHITLADPDFNQASPIDMILGAHCFWALLHNEQIKFGKNLPIAQNTLLGWVLSGPISIQNTTTVSFNIIDLQNQLSKFWEIEELSKTKAYSNEEKLCEEHFTKNLSRDRNGRFIVSIPFKESPSKLGNSQQSALKQFYNLEHKLQSNPLLNQYYQDFMDEYKNLGHMTKVSIIKQPNFFLPHHGVLKESSNTTKLRTVFNGSAPSSSGWCLNKIQMIGPNIQQDLLSILLRFRKHQYVVSADIAKMYRQILVNPSDRQFQYIYWRKSPTDNLAIYALNTVTYGTASAPFLAIRSLKQLAMIYKEEYPLACETIIDDFYVDDLLTGSNSIEQLSQICKQINDILHKGCFELRKWSSNSPEFLHKLNPQDISDHNYYFNDSNSKTLGLRWSHQTDKLFYSIPQYERTNHLNKRIMLSRIAQNFDPLGLLAPCTIIAKVMLQKLWSSKVSWDEPLPGDLQQEWLTFQTKLLTFNTLEIPRCVMRFKQSSVIELHGFCDASISAYGACIYIRSVMGDNTHTQILCAKSRVAPLKMLTIPRLELCGALILAKLYKRVTNSFKIEFNNYYLWCYSTIVLGWIRTAPNILQTFPSNRVAEIQSLTDVRNWRHVPSAQNPADFLSRGYDPIQLQTENMWWYGPSFLSLQFSFWPPNITSREELPELKKTTKCHLNINSSKLVDRYSSLNKLIRIVAYCKRFVRNSRGASADREFDFLKTNELEESLKCLVKQSQIETFSKELDLIKNNKTLPNRIIGLAPFIDSEGILRVGGRLQNSKFYIHKQHPILLSSKHKLCQLIFQSMHLKLLHAGPQMLLSAVRDRFWALGGRNLSRNVIRKCGTCYKFSPKVLNPIMGQLPKHRLILETPFYVTGLDYAGPFEIIDRKGRGAKSRKCYMCVFVCFAVKAIHLELITDMTTEAFIACLKRFISRRGKPAHIYSDNATNFVGARNYLNAFLVTHSKLISEYFAGEQIVWHLIPPSSPHFGGLWEAGVKSTKHHLKRVVSNAKLTFEELNTLIVEIECILNCRPLTPLSSDLNDLDSLTPAHFLVGKKLSSLPDQNLMETKSNRLTRFQHVQKLQQHFWTRWAKEYVSELQQRCKWKQNQHNIKLDTMVLVKDNNLPSCKWRLGRIIKLHPGNDNIVRVVSIKTQAGVIKRPVCKVCPLPTNDQF